MAKYDKSMEYISQTQTLIGTQRKRLVDQDTGELIEVDQITKSVRAETVLEDLSHGFLAGAGWF